MNIEKNELLQLIEDFFYFKNPDNWDKNNNIEYDCSGFQTKADDAIKQIKKILDSYYKDFSYYFLSHPDDDKFFDACDANHRIKKFLKTYKDGI